MIRMTVARSLRFRKAFETFFCSQELESEGEGTDTRPESEGGVEAPDTNVKYAVGSDVMVARGPFAGLTGEVTSRDGEKQEVRRQRLFVCGLVG